MLASVSKSVEAWVNIYPEIARWMNIKIGDKNITCVLSIVEKNIKNSLSSIMDVSQDRVKSKYNSSFGQETKAMGNQILAMICNLLVLTIISLLLSTMFG